MITIDQYFMGRDKKYASELTNEIRNNAAETVRRANLLLVAFHVANPTAGVRTVNSGWRPAAVNMTVPGAARKSNHLLGKAIDISDDDGELDEWLLTQPGQKALEQIGLWMEHPASTPRWAHVQISPPGSGKRVFRP